MKTNLQETLLDGLGQELHKQYIKAKNDRDATESRWLDDIRQVKGIYSPDEESRMQPGKSRHHSRLTRIKVKSATAKLMDLVFPAGSTDNWSFSPTPVSDVSPSPAVMNALVTKLQRIPSPAEIAEAVTLQAEQAAKAMQQEVKDQLIEAKYRKKIKQIINSGNLFGTGILKGPLVDRTYRKSWVLDETGEWTLISAPTLSPFIEFVPVWEMYPDSMATSFSEARFNFQRSVMPKHQVIELTSRQDFSRKRIKQYLMEHPDGDAELLDWELELRRLGWDVTGDSKSTKRYEVLEYWGTIDAQKLIDIGLDIPDDSQEEFWANVWLLGSTIIKIEVQPIEGMQLPYFAYYWDKDETSIFGEGIPAVIRDDDKAHNASIRAMMDNAAICAGPMLEVNVDLIDPGEDPRDVHPFKVFLRSGVGVEAQYPAIREIRLNSHTQEYASLANFFANNIHEATLPSYMHGEATSKGSVGRTASGLSMLMSAAQVTFKDQLLSLDDDVQAPFLESLYHWNMQFNPKAEIKGDFNVQVKGTSSLVAREIRAANLDAFANSTLNQFDGPYIDRQALNKERASILELGGDIVLSEEQAIRKIATQAIFYGTQQTGNAQGSQPTTPGTQGVQPLPGVQPAPQVLGGETAPSYGEFSSGSFGSSAAAPGEMGGLQ